MLNVTQELSNKIADGNHWLVHDDVNVLDAHASRNAARAAKGEHKVKQWDGTEGFNLLNGNGHDDSIQGVVDNLAAAGLQATVIDENTDFSKLNLGGADTPHDLGPREEQSEFAKDKEEMTADPQPTVKPIDPVKEVKPKPEISHKSTVEKPTKLVHTICDMLYEANADVTRKEIIAACTNAGIAHYTILTQYQAWKAARS